MNRFLGRLVSLLGSPGEGASAATTSSPERHLALRSGATLSPTIKEYDEGRRFVANRRLRAACYAPFLSMDFDATGAVRLCNHSHTQIARVSDDISILDLWRGAAYERYRQEMQQYVLDDHNCRHCIRQCEVDSSAHVFGVQQFDEWANDNPSPLFPTRLIFRLNNTCNLACVMCDGQTSSRIRRERDGLPLAPSMYGDRFFAEMETILPHVAHIEFYGGEPFLVKEHDRIFDILKRLEARCSIYINTNGVSLNQKARQRLETLNFRTIAVSMDAASKELHEVVRSGIRHDTFLKNLDYFLELRERRGVDVMLNVTEHRKNWFELPEIFRFAEERRLPLHINTCIHPHNVTLYTLPSRELAYVLTLLESERRSFEAEFPSSFNLGSYQFLTALIRDELYGRGPDWAPVVENCNVLSDGLLATPLAGLPPFVTSASVRAEADRIADQLDTEVATRMLVDLRERAQSLAPHEEWKPVAERIETLLERCGLSADTYPPKSGGDVLEDGLGTSEPLGNAGVVPLNSTSSAELGGRSAIANRDTLERPTVAREEESVPVVSVVIIFLNGEEFLEEALASVAAQTYDDWEVILVDDGSTDSSAVIARAFLERHPERATYLTHPGLVNRGMSASRNLGIAHARGAYIAFLDADDVWLAEKLAAQIDLMDSHPDVSMTIGATQYWYGWSNETEGESRDYVAQLGVPTERTYDAPMLASLLYPIGPGAAPCICSLLVRRAVFERTGGFEEEFTGFFEDQAFLVKAYLRERIWVSSSSYEKYRIHPDSCSAHVERLGDYDERRAGFLAWLASQIDAWGVTDARILAAVPHSLESQHPVQRRMLHWTLRTDNGNVARLESRSTLPLGVRIEVIRAVSDAPYDTQINLPGLRFDAAELYRLTFYARADRSRSIGLGVALDRSPWSNLGLYETIDLVELWVPFTFEFTPASAEEDARLHFDLGRDSASVEFSSVLLERVINASPVWQAEHAAAGGSPNSPQTSHLPENPVPFGAVDFGSLTRLTPISRDFGCDRGTPIDRYYIEQFLAENAADVKGRVLEIGDRTYTVRFGGDRVERSDILHVVEGDPQATIIADLADGANIPSETFDCVILTQTLQLIYDVPAALNTLRRILKPGGSLLATFPGISQTYDHEWSSTWYWNFTRISAQRLFSEAFGQANITVTAYGNVFAAISFLHGVAVEEVDTVSLDLQTTGYDVTLAVRAVKPDRRSVAPSARASSGVPSVMGAGHSTLSSSSIVLMYHRIGQSCSDPFALSVSSEHFAEQMEVLAGGFHSVHLEELSGSSPKSLANQVSVAVTFDDGYADNLYAAKPILERFGIPATVFVTSGNLGTGREFWWDELARLILESAGESRVQFRLAGVEHRVTLGARTLASGSSWRSSDPPTTQREEGFLRIWRLLQFQAATERLCVLDQLRQQGEPSVAPCDRLPLSRDELRDLAADGLVAVGGHTVTHPVLSRLSPAEQREEIFGCRSELESACGLPVVSFSYPFGSPPDFTADTIEMVRQAGFVRACTTSPMVVSPSTQRFEIPRFQVGDWGREEFSRRLSSWIGQMGTLRV